ncbi:hypothetical protein FVE85_9551 [Porphyridium purpureum]|uniref:Uncharacterized protein n=1 Tax=Porphyridium purpureum TaxID=35688 RepID=A0A5J4YIF0_PORPP|nr:hypothetical protein FVE85_9551 [Porphyridium purpureum]|eukprot:POR5741..scf261_15
MPRQRRSAVHGAGKHLPADAAGCLGVAEASSTASGVKRKASERADGKELQVQVHTSQPQSTSRRRSQRLLNRIFRLDLLPEAVILQVFKRGFGMTEETLATCKDDQGAPKPRDMCMVVASHTMRLNYTTWRSMVSLARTCKNAWSAFRSMSIHLNVPLFQIPSFVRQFQHCELLRRSCHMIRLEASYGSHPHLCDCDPQIMHSFAMADGICFDQPTRRDFYFLYELERHRTFCLQRDGVKRLCLSNMKTASVDHDDHSIWRAGADERAIDRSDLRVILRSVRDVQEISMGGDDKATAASAVFCAMSLGHMPLHTINLRNCSVCCVDRLRSRVKGARITENNVTKLDSSPQCDQAVRSIEEFEDLADGGAGGFASLHFPLLVFGHRIPPPD